VESKAKDEASKVMIHMKERLTKFSVLHINRFLKLCV